MRWRFCYINRYIVCCEFVQELSADPARCSERLLLICHHSDRFEFMVSLADGLTCGGSFGTNRWTIRRIFYVASGWNGAIGQTDSGANLKFTVRAAIVKLVLRNCNDFPAGRCNSQLFIPVRKCSSLDCGVDELLRVIIYKHGFISSLHNSIYTVVTQTQTLYLICWTQLYCSHVLFHLLRSSSCFATKQYNWALTITSFTRLEICDSPLWCEYDWKVVKWTMDPGALYTHSVEQFRFHVKIYVD